MHADQDALEAGLVEIRRSPAEVGRLELIVARPSVNERVEHEEGSLDVGEGLVGDSWRSRGGPDKAPNPKAQLTLMNSRAAALIAQSDDRRALAGDQLYVDLDIGGRNLPPGSQLEIGSAIVEITDEPHRGCRKFMDRFGAAALRFVNSPAGIEVNARGVNARVVRGGTVHRGDTVRKLTS